MFGYPSWLHFGLALRDTQKLLPPSLPPKKPKVHIHLQAGSVQGPCGMQRQYPDVSIKLERGNYRPRALSDTLNSHSSPVRDLRRSFASLERAPQEEAHSSKQTKNYPETNKSGSNPEYEVETVTSTNRRNTWARGDPRHSSRVPHGGLPGDGGRRYATQATGVPEIPVISPPAEPRIDTSGPTNPRVWRCRGGRRGTSPSTPRPTGLGSRAGLTRWRR